jgi:hypothetical protein
MNDTRKIVPPAPEADTATSSEPKSMPRRQRSFDFFLWSTRKMNSFAAGPNVDEVQHTSKMLKDFEPFSPSPLLFVLPTPMCKPQASPLPWHGLLRCDQNAQGWAAHAKFRSHRAPTRAVSAAISCPLFMMLSPSLLPQVSPVLFALSAWLVYSVAVWIWVRSVIFREMQLIAAIFNNAPDSEARVSSAVRHLSDAALLRKLLPGKPPAGEWEQIWPVSRAPPDGGSPWNYASADLRIRRIADGRSQVLARVPPPTASPLRNLLRNRPSGGAVARAAARLAWSRWISAAVLADAAAGGLDPAAAREAGPAPELVGEWKFSGFRSYVNSEEVRILLRWSEGARVEVDPRFVGLDAWTAVRARRTLCR